MRQFFSTKVSYAKETDQGLLKNVTEEYIFEGVSFTDIEQRIYETMGEIMRGDFLIKSITKSNITDIFFYDNSEYWHKCKIQYSIVDENSGKEKKISQYMLVNAESVQEAFIRINESLSNMLVTFSVPEVVETKIQEVYMIESEVEEKPIFSEV